MPRMITVLEDCIRYRDGKKWKRRYCFLSKPDSKKRTVTMFITKHFGVNISNQDIDDKCRRQYLIDEITGFEYGRHVDKESHVMALIGCNVVYCIAFENTDTMFRWAETLSKLLTSVNFHVTLKKVSEIGGLFKKITVGTQGNLHVQQSRLSLIGEPADGNKFICEWSITNLISLNIYDTDCDKIKKLQIKCNGKKGKGHFDFEISLTQTSLFNVTFSSFLTSCKEFSPEFKSNFLLKYELGEMSLDNSYSYSIVCKDNNHSNSEHSSSLEKRSSEIPIPRSREHSGPDQRPIENVQIKIRKSHKKIQNVKHELQKHYSVIETIGKHDHDSCLFPDDEEIEEQVHHKSQHLLCRALSQESSGVYVNGPSDSMRDVDRSVQDDSGCGLLPSNLLQSTSSTRHDNVLPPCQKSKSNIFLSFYRNVCRNPFSLTNYTNYYRLLRTVADKRSHLLRRSNSFNCVELPEMKKFEYCRKYSHTNFHHNFTNQTWQQHLKMWKDKLNNESLEDSFMSMNLDGDICEECEESTETLLSHKLPFRSMKEFNCAMIRCLKSGTICFSLFAYHHFLSLITFIKSTVKNIDGKDTVNDAVIEYKNMKEQIYRKKKEYNHDYSDVTDPSILDLNTLMAIEIIDSICHLRSSFNPAMSDIMQRPKSYFDTTTNPTIELNDSKFLVGHTSESHMSPDLSTESSSIYLESRPILCMSCSTPDFHHFYQHERKHKLSNIETRYQNISGTDTFDTMNHTFPKQNIPDSSHSKEGSFKRLRRKCSPNVFIPFIRRKTSSTHSTVSEPICHNDSREQNSYYNISNQSDTYSKKSSSVLLNSRHYVNMKHCPKYINMSEKSGITASNDSSNYLNIDPSMYDDDDTPYPAEIVDPSRNYGDLNFIKSRMRYTRFYNDIRRSSLSILSQKSLQNYGTSRSVSFHKRDYSRITRVHSGACNNFPSTDYIDTNTLDLSAYSFHSCCAEAARKIPRSLNYVTVVEHNTFPNKLSKPLSISTENESDNFCYPNRKTRSLCHGRTPQSSPSVDYCTIDLNCTYALRDIDRKLYDKIKQRDTNSLKNRSPDEMDSSFKSLEQMPDNYSLASLSGSKDKKSQKSGFNSFRQLFSRKSDLIG